MPDASSDESSATVRVAVRVRPLTPKEHMQNTNECISYLPTSETSSTSTLLLDSTRTYTFDHIFQPNSVQDQVFDSVKSMCHRFVDGYNTTVLAYGQTGSGKTFTMGTGLSNENEGSDIGIIPRAIDLIFHLLQEKCTNLTGFKFSVSVTFLELYNEELIDLLNPHTRSSARKGSALSIREDASGNVFWAGVKEETVSDSHDLISYLRKGSVCRTTGSTDMNLTSSRSHAIYSIILRQEVPELTNSNVPTDANSSNFKRLSSKFHFVDLAGSERMKKTKAVGDRAKEGISINSGLLAMGKVIHALNDGASHVPYRDSKLTRLLQDALGGNSQTLMIACVSPADSNFGETLNTLNYASRARNIKNRVVQNQDYQAMEVHQLRAEISRLKMELLTIRTQTSMPRTTSISTNAGNAVSSGDWIKKENEGLVSEIRRLEMLVYQLQQKNSELRNELTISRSERDSLLFVQNQNQNASSDSVSEPTVHPIISNYQHIISDLQAKLEEIQIQREFTRYPNSSTESLFVGSKRSRPASSVEAILGSDSNLYSHNGSSLSVVSSSHVIQQSPLHKRINATIEKAKQEILKEREILDQTRSQTPTKLDELTNNSTDDETDELGNPLNPTKTEDDMLNLLDQISSDIKIKEELVTQLQHTQSEYHVMKGTYEEKLKQMQEQVFAIQRERDLAMRKMDTTDDRDKNQVAILKTRYEERLKKLSNEMADIKKKYQEVQKEMMNKRHTNDALISSMKVHTESLKKEKLKLLKRMKEKEMLTRDRELERERELNNLKRREKQSSEMAKKLERNNRMQKLMLKKRTEENVQTQSKLRSVMSLLKKTKNLASPLTKRAWKNSSNSQTEGPSTPTKDNSSFDENLEHKSARSNQVESTRDEEKLKLQAQFKKNLLYEQINTFVSGQQANQVMEDLVKKRNELIEEKSELEEELAQLNSKLDLERQRAIFNHKNPEEDEQIEMISQQRQDGENRLEIIEAEIQYYGARIKSIQIEAAANSIGNSTIGQIAPEDSYDNAIDIVQSLSNTESKKLLEIMLDDLISFRLLERSRQMEIRALTKDKQDLALNLEAMKRAAIESALDSNKKEYLSKRSKLSDTTGILEDVRALENDMEEIENSLQQSGIDVTSPRGRSRSMEFGRTSDTGIGLRKPPFLPAGLQTNTSNTSINNQQQQHHNLSKSGLYLYNLAKESKDRTNNVFERLHKEQTIASQMKMKEALLHNASQPLKQGGKGDDESEQNDNLEDINHEGRLSTTKEKE